MVIQGGSFKGRTGDLKPKEVVSLLLDDEEIETRVREKAAEAEKERRPEAETAVSSTGGKRKLARSNSDSLGGVGGKRKVPRSMSSTDLGGGAHKVAAVTQDEAARGAGLENNKFSSSPSKIAKIVRQRSVRPWPSAHRRRPGGGGGGNVATSDHQVVVTPAEPGGALVEA